MYKIENLKYEKSKLFVQGFSGLSDATLIIYQGKNKILEEKLNVTRPDIQSIIDDYQPGKFYGFDFKCKCNKPKFKIVLNKDNENIVIYKTNNYYLRKKLSNVKRILKYILNSFKILWEDYHFIVPISKWKEFGNLFYRKVIKRELLNSKFYNPFSVDDYNAWIIENEYFEEVKKFKYNPKISLIMPVYNVKSTYLTECLDSILNQTYKNFEICIADDASTNKDTLRTLKEYETKYPELIKVKYRKKNGHISEATNTALELATGEFVGLIDNDDTLTPDALYEVIKLLNQNKKLDMIYSDEDKINLDGKRCEPHFKPDFSPDTLYSHNYICHFTVIRKSIMMEIKGFRKGYEGAQDYDLFLRVVEKTKNVAHIPKVLYHWRMIPGSTSMEVSNKNYASQNGIKALNDALKRNKLKGEVENYYTSYIIKYLLPNNPLVSIIIPTRDKINILKNCITSILEKTTYKNYEIIILDNGSVEQETLEYFKDITLQNKNIFVERIDKPFNYSYLNNIGVKKSNGEYLVLLNNDIEIISKNWIEIMLGYAMQKHIGAVGPKLLFANEKIQHAGVVVGIGEGYIANHAFYLEDRKAPAPAGRLVVPYNYSAVTGACIMISKEKYNEVNGLEEKLAVNYNDVDFCLKLLDKGYYNVLLPQVELYHLESISRGKINNEEKSNQLKKEQDFMKKKWKEKLSEDKFYNPNYSKMYCFKLDKRGLEDEEKN